MIIENTFWIVWNMSGVGCPTHRHATYEEAKNEAMRLASLHVAEFAVLQCVSSFKKCNIVETKYKERS